MEQINISPLGFVIDWKQIDAVINHIKNAKTVYYDPLKQQYIVDGVIIDVKFFNECIGKASHLINTLANVQLVNKVIVNIDSIKETAKPEGNHDQFK